MKEFIAIFILVFIVLTMFLFILVGIIYLSNYILGDVGIILGVIFIFTLTLTMLIYFGEKDL